MPNPSFSAAERDKSIVAVFFSLTSSLEENLRSNGFIFTLVLEPAVDLGDASA